MTVIPLTSTTLVLRTNADMDQPMIRWQDEAGTTPLDLTGYSLRMVARDADDNELFEASTANSRVVVTDAADGAFSIRVPASVLAAAVTSDIEGSWDLQATTPGGAKEVWAMGRIRIHLGVAR